MRLLDALSWRLEIWQFRISVKDVANGRCLVDMYISPAAGAGAQAIGIFSHILREASASLLVQLRWAHARASNRGTSNSTALTLFLF